MKQIKHNLKFIISIAILIMVTFITNCYLVKADETKNPSINSTITFYGNMSNEKGIILKWSKVPKSKGYVIYRNNKKIATIKINKIKNYTDKKVKAGKKYTYQIAPYTEVKGKKVLGVKSYKIRVKATKRNAKKINPARVVIPDLYYEDNYYVGLYESIKLHEELVDKGSRLAISDVGCGVQALRGAILSAQLNVIINVGLMKDKEYAKALDEKCEALVKEGIQPKLAILRVGAKPNDLSYERGALKKCDTIGIVAEVTELSEDTTQEQYIEALEKLNKDSSVHGILTFRPLPKGIDEEVIKNVISPEKDVDCFSPMNTAKLMEGDKTGFPPCTPTAVVEILKHYNVPLKGANVVVLGRSMVVGKPVSMLLLGENATVTICHSKTQDLSKVCSQADVLVAGVGRARMVKADYVKEGAVVIDVGINAKPEGGGICGDVDTDDVVGKASMVTPVPAGVGSVTTSILAKHVIKACKQQNNK